MRTTLVISDELFQQAKPLIGEQRFSQFVRDAVRYYIAKLQEEKLAREMEEGYKAEAAAPSLEPEWSDSHPNYQQTRSDLSVSNSGSGG